MIWGMKSIQNQNQHFTQQDGDTEALLASDFEIGHLIRDRIIPRAILYFTGEIDDEFDEEGEEEEDDVDDVSCHN